MTRVTARVGWFVYGVTFWLKNGEKRHVGPGAHVRVAAGTDGDSGEIPQLLGFDLNPGEHIARVSGRTLAGMPAQGAGPPPGQALLAGVTVATNFGRERHFFGSACAVQTPSRGSTVRPKKYFCCFR